MCHRPEPTLEGDGSRMGHQAPLETLIPNAESPDRPWPASSQPEGSCVCTCVLCVGVSVCTGGGVHVWVRLLAPGLKCRCGGRLWSLDQPGWLAFQQIQEGRKRGGEWRFHS